MGVISLLLAFAVDYTNQYSFGLCTMITVTPSKDKAPESKKNQGNSELHLKSRDQKNPCKIKLHSECEETIPMKVPDAEESFDYEANYAEAMAKMEKDCGYNSDSDDDELKKLEEGYNKGRGVPEVKAPPKRKK